MQHNQTNPYISTLPDFSSSRILVIGDVMLDRYLIGNSDRISPEAPVPVVKVNRQELRPGGAANVAANLAALGCRTYLLSIAGDDFAAQELVSKVAFYGVNIDLIRSESFRTTEKTRIISNGQQITRFDYDSNVTDDYRQLMKKQYQKLINEIDVVVFSDYCKGVLDNINELIEIANIHDKPCIVDPKRSDPTFYSGAFILKPNQQEFELMFGTCNSKNELIQRGINYARELNIGHLVATRGKDGIILISKNGNVVEIPTVAKEVFDVSGAGDSVIAMLSACIGCGEDILSSVKMANIAAGIAVSHLGTYVVSINDIISYVETVSYSREKLKSKENLIKIVNILKASNKKIVFTNGCFDIIHPGHVRLLREAKSKGDVLIVAVNSDSSIKKIKGSNRPINKFNDRIEVISALETVDYIVEFDDDTPIELITAIKPDVLVKGGDYDTNQIVGSSLVVSLGGVVLSLPFHEGYSSTKVIEKCSSQN